MILKYSKEAKIDFNARDNRGKTPLHYLYQSRAKENVERFMTAAKEEYGIEFDQNATDNEGCTPAQLSGNPGFHDFLLMLYSNCQPNTN